MAPLPHLLEDVLPALHEAHEDVEGGEDGRADQELVQQHLLRDGGRRLAHEPGPMRARRAVTWPGYSSLIGQSPGVQPAVPVVQDHGEHEGADHPVPAQYSTVLWVK